METGKLYNRMRNKLYTQSQSKKLSIINRKNNNIMCFFISKGFYLNILQFAIGIKIH